MKNNSILQNGYSFDSKDEMSQKMMMINRRRRVQKAKAVRARALAFALFTTIVITLFIPFGKKDIEAGVRFEKQYIAIEVKGGDTLWGYAEKYADKAHYESFYDYIEEVAILNRLDSSVIYTGDELVLPVIRIK